MKSQTALIVSLVALSTVLLFKGVNININLTQQASVPPEIAFLKEVLQKSSVHEDVEFLFVQPNQQFYGDYSSNNYPRFFRDTEDLSIAKPPVIRVPLFGKENPNCRDADEEILKSIQAPTTEAEQEAAEKRYEEAKKLLRKAPEKG